MQLTNTTRVTRRWDAKQRVSSLREPSIEYWAELREWPNRHDRHEPLPARQDANHFDPGEVAFGPTTITSASVHLLRHLFTRVWRGTLQNFRIVIIKPLNLAIAVERLYARAHPPAEIAIAVGVDFNFITTTHRLEAGYRPPMCSLNVWRAVARL